MGKIRPRRRYVSVTEEEGRYGKIQSRRSISVTEGADPLRASLISTLDPVGGHPRSWKEERSPFRSLQLRSYDLQLRFHNLPLRSQDYLLRFSFPAVIP